MNNRTADGSSRTAEAALLLLVPRRTNADNELEAELAHCYKQKITAQWARLAKALFMASGS